MSPTVRDCARVNDVGDGSDVVQVAPSVRPSDHTLKEQQRVPPKVAKVLQFASDVADPVPKPVLPLLLAAFAR